MAFRIHYSGRCVAPHATQATQEPLVQSSRQRIAKLRTMHQQIFFDRAKTIDFAADLRTRWYGKRDFLRWYSTPSGLLSEEAFQLLRTSPP